ncbi:PAS domain S-box protein [candidate division WOR-3 bacterium]|nr:PAS domain S-box protein [candidate division WOR-3 bacterium]
MAKSDPKREKDLRAILAGIEHIRHGAVSVRVNVSGRYADLASIANGLNSMLKEIKATKDYERDTHTALERATNKLKRIFTHSNDIILQVNKFGTIVDINESVEEIIGYKPDELRGKHFAKFNLIPKDASSSLTKSFKDSMASGEVTPVIELELLTRDGATVAIEASTRLLRSGDDIEGAVVILRNVTRRKQAEAALGEHRETLRSIVASMEDFVFILDKEGNFLEYYQSPEHPGLFSSPADYQGKSVKDVFPDMIAQEFSKTISISMKKKIAQQIDFPWEMLGATLWFNARISPRLDNDGSSCGVTVVIRDITPRTQMEKALRESEKRYKKIFENSPQGYILLDREGHIIDVNKKICNWLGYQSEEILGKHHILYPFLTKTGKATAMMKFSQRLAGKVVPAYELEFLTKDGKVFIGEILAMPIHDDTGEITQILAMITDVTERNA